MVEFLPEALNAGAFGLVVYGFWRLHRSGMDERRVQAETYQTLVRELQPNGGMSVKDKVDKISSRQDEMALCLQHVEEEISKLRVRVDCLDE